MPAQLKDYFTQQLETVKTLYLKDFDALPADQLGTSPGGAARTPLDLTFEVAYVNRRLAQRIRGEEPEKWPGDGWMEAPEGFSESARQSLADSMDEVIAAWKNVPDDELMRTIQLPNDVTSPLDLVYTVCLHTNYHDGQIAYLQTFYGDDKMHW